MDILCRVCMKRVGKAGFTNHLRFHHDLDMVGYSRRCLEKDKNILFVYHLKEKKIRIKDFKNSCRTCGSPFHMVMQTDNEVRVRHCSNKDCRDRRPFSRIVKFFWNEDQIKLITDYMRESFRESRASKEKFIRDHGKEEGLKRYNSWIARSRQDRESFIRRYGKEKGEKRYNSFVEKSKQTKKNFIKRYGEKKGKIEWEKYRKLKSDSSSRTLAYWLKRCNNDFERASRMLALSQRRDKKFFILKFGKEEGEKRYKDRCRRVGYSTTLEGMIENHGEKRGREFYEKKSEDISKASSFEGLVETFGRKRAVEIIKNRCKGGARYSKISKELFDDLMEKCSFLEKEDVFYAKKEWFISSKETGFMLVDFYIKSLSFVIEFHGDFWHANPELFGENDIHRISGMTAKEIWKNDERREKIARKALNLKKYIVVWERDYVRDKSETVKKLVEEIYEVYKNK